MMAFRRNTNIIWRFHIWLFSLLIITLQHESVNGQSTWFYSRYKSNYSNAMADCARIGGFLAKLDSAAKFSNVTANIDRWLIEEQQLWIGYGDQQSEGDYRWYDGSPLVWTDWNSGDPSNSEQENCGAIFGQKMADKSCSVELYFICEVFSDSPEALMHRDTLSCWVANDLLRPVEGEESDAIGDVKCPRNKIYFTPSHIQNAESWQKADAHCKEANSLLAKVKSEEEMIIIDRFRKVKLFDEAWIGGTDLSVEGEYRWADGELFTWPDFEFLTVSKPADDTSKNCLSSSHTSQWNSRSCANKYPILCEMDIDLRPEGEACYWHTPGNRWWLLRDLCEESGGTLISPRDVRQFEKALDIFIAIDDVVFMGFSDDTRSGDFRWVDGSVMLWAWWEPGEPTLGTISRPYGATWNSNQYRNIQWNYWKKGACEKQISRFLYAKVDHIPGSIEVTCSDGCTFADGTTRKSWTCEEVSWRHDTCNCPGEWIIEGEQLSGLNTSLLFDNDTSSCLDLTDITYILTLQHSLQFVDEFTVQVHIHNDPSAIVRVLTSDYERDAKNSCPKALQYRKCLPVDNFRYKCTCQRICRLSVKIAFVLNSLNVHQRHQVCEIGFAV